MSSPTEPFEFAEEEEPQDQEADAVESEEEAEPEEPDYQRRYEERDRQYRESSKEGRRLHAELIRAQERERALAQALESTRQPAPQQREPRWRERLSTVSSLEEAMPLLEEMAEDIAEQKAAERAEAKVAQMMEPFLKAAEAQGQMQEELGDFDRVQVNRFLNENPDVKASYDRRLTESPVGAMAYALYKMEKAGAYDSEAGMHADHEEAQEVKRQTRKAARVTGSKRTAPKDREPNIEDENERLAKLAEFGRANRHYQPYVDYRLGLLKSLKKIQWADGADDE
jgi:hypothetical protein